ncbi:hypothetical protein Pint_26747 [Pistacia integerrima]|uniref:Uncharacterized protein n=1 Tax=Pistacia integerrima TaxID=434235 RepID=A0ACC0YMW5_9ROSI|nr:hypothetical protein Pint_26747 [Pistacia integerrima]
MILSWLVNYVSCKIASSVMSLDTAKENNLPVATYYTMLKGLWDDLTMYTIDKACEHYGASKAHQTVLVIQVLMGLNDSYSQIRGQILPNDPLPPLSKVSSGHGSGHSYHHAAATIIDQTDKKESTSVPTPYQFTPKQCEKLLGLLKSTNSSPLSIAFSIGLGDIEDNWTRSNPSNFTDDSSPMAISGPSNPSCKSPSISKPHPSVANLN